MVKSIEHIEAAYADKKVAEIDATIEADKAEIKALTEKRKMYAPHMTKRKS
jgi:hypothetical protein